MLRQFLGIIGWLKKYILRFAITAAPLTDLLAKTSRWKWTPTEVAAFEALKDVLRRLLVLHRLSTDKMADLLYQEDEDKSQLIIAYVSAKFSPAERKYHVNEQECLVIVWAIKRYRHYLEGRDERAKLTRWSLLLQEFDFTVERRPGYQAPR